MNSPESGRSETTIVPFGTNRALEEIRFAAPYPTPPRKEPTLRDYWHILLRRKWAVISFMFIVMTLVTIISLRMQAKYESSGRIAVARETPEVFGLHNDSTNGNIAAVDDISLLLETQVQVLESEQLSLMVAHKLRSGAPRAIPEISSATNFFPGAIAPPTPEEVSLAGRLRSGLSVTIVPRTQIIEIRYKDPDPQMAARVVQAYIDSYLESNFDSKFQSIKQTTEWLTQQLSDLQTKVEVSQEKLVRYQREHNIVGVDDKQNITTSRLDDLNKQLTDAELDRILKETRYQGAKNGDAELIAKTDSGALIGKLRDTEADLNNRLAQLLVVYGPSYPKVQELKSQLAQTEKAISAERVKMLAGLQADYLVAANREKMLRAEFEKQKSAANDLNESAIEYNLLKRDVDTNRQLYEGLLQRLKEAGVVAGLRSSNVTVIDPARVPKYPVEPNIPRNLALGFMIGLLGGIGLAGVLEMMDNTVNLPEDVEAASGLPVIGIVPETRQIVDGKSKANNGLEKLALKKTPALSPPPLLSHERPQSQAAEAYRALRTSVLLSSTPPKIILVTSALPQEGKTTTAVNLAIVLAQRGGKVLLIDGDLRRARIHKFFKGTQASGLSTLLNGQDDISAVLLPTLVPGLNAVFAGPTPPQPAEMLSSDRMRRHLAQWRNEFDHIVIDSPPVLSVTDAALLSVESDSVLLVIRSRQTAKDALRRASELLAQVKARVQGVVVNAIDMDQPHYYYYYGANYGAYYRDNA
ncbi:MAG: polysaccharide biosynthesis tyrosine autokinase [Terriglobia bacterium]|nr:polysaccharide biosynthesis tyrosine autokinase [Terriglobia bacterium]